VTGRATFGDFLRQAHQDLDQGAQPYGTAPRENLGEVISGLAWLVAVLRRYTQDLTTTPGITPRAQPVLGPRGRSVYPGRWNSRQGGTVPGFPQRRAAAVGREAIQ
jgi:hypothetical protein